MSKTIAIRVEKIRLLKERGLAEMKRLEQKRRTAITRFFDAVSKRKEIQARKKIDEYGST